MALALSYLNVKYRSTKDTELKDRALARDKNKLNK